MVKRLPLMILVAACLGCAEEQPPQPDPEKLEALLSSAETTGKEPGKTERLINSVEKIPPERIDPQIALAVVAD